MSKSKTKGAVKRHPVLKNPIVLTVAITLAVLLVFGSAAGIVVAVRNSRAVISYGGVRIEASAAAYLATTNKASFISRYNAVDDPVFWEAEYGDGMTYGELLEAQTEQYLREIAAGAYLFDRYSSLTSDEKKTIKATAEDVVINYYGTLDKKAFNEQAASMGFDYDGFVDALTLTYKAKEAMRRIYGDDGSVLASGGYSSECEKYLSTFVYTKLLFIRTEYEYKTDGNGEYLRDEAGNLIPEELDPKVKEKREADVAEIRAAIAALESGDDEQMSEGYFNSMLGEYSFDDYTLTGYYFSTVVDADGIPLASATASFANYVGTDVLNLVFSLEIGEYGELETDYGICFAYRGTPAPSAYTSDTYELFFSDFYSDASSYLYLDKLVEIAKSVTVKDGYYSKVDVVALPYNSEFVLRGGFVSQ